MFKLCLLIPFFALGTHPLPAEDFSTVNRDKLNHFFDSFENGRGPIRVLTFGDSMSDSYLSIAFHFANRFLERRLYAGSSFNNAYNRLLWTSTDGATLAPPSALWFSYQFKIPPGSSVSWENWFSPGGILSDRLALYWVAQSEGGSFDLLVSENAGPWVKQFTLDGYSPTPEGRFTNLTVSLREHRIKVASSSGTNFIIGPELVNTVTNGLHLAWLDYPGLAVSDVVAVPLAVREPILRAFAPDLLIWHFKEGPSFFPQFTAALAENEAWFKRAAPQMDVLYLGTPFADDGGEAHTAEGNTIVRSFALEQGRAFLDCMTPGISYEWLRDHNYMADAVHPNSAGSEFLAEAGWNDIGFFALGVDRQLTLTQSRNTLTLHFTKSPSIIYELQSSTNLAYWSTFHRTSGLGPSQFPVSPTAPATHYRIKLLPAE